MNTIIFFEKRKRSFTNFVLCVQNRNPERMIDFTAAILNNIVRTKRPVVLVTTKTDEGSEILMKEAERLVNRKEFKGTIPLVETSAHDNVNVDTAFLLLAQMMDTKYKGHRIRVLPYYEVSPLPLVPA
jgi:predicted GTPase